MFLTDDRPCCSSPYVGIVIYDTDNVEEYLWAKSVVMISLDFCFSDSTTSLALNPKPLQVWRRAGSLITCQRCGIRKPLHARYV